MLCLKSFAFLSSSFFSIKELANPENKQTFDVNRNQALHLVVMSFSEESRDPERSQPEKPAKCVTGRISSHLFDILPPLPED